jgi:hypothetical protein
MKLRIEKHIGDRGWTIIGNNLCPLSLEEAEEVLRRCEIHEGLIMDAGLIKKTYEEGYADGINADESCAETTYFKNDLARAWNKSEAMNDNCKYCYIRLRHEAGDPNYKDITETCKYCKEKKDEQDSNS